MNERDKEREREREREKAKKKREKREYLCRSHLFTPSRTTPVTSKLAIGAFWGVVFGPGSTLCSRPG